MNALGRTRLVSLCMLGWMTMGLTGLSSGLVQAQNSTAAAPQVSNQAPASNLPQDDAGAPKSMEEKANFVIGYNFVRSLKSQKVDYLLESLIAGMRAAAADKEIGMSDEELTAVMSAFEQRMMERFQAKLKAEAEENQIAGEKYLEANRTKEGVLALPSGVQYKVLKAGSGDKAMLEDKVEVHYAGRTIDGKVFDSSIERNEPATHPVAGFIKGFSEALQNMKVGDRWEVTIPAQLAYGMKAPADIGPNQVLVFEIELLKVIKN